MNLMFSPALRQMTTVKVPASHPADNSSHTQIIYFKAAFASRESYRQAQSSGIKVELWTNLPLRESGHAQGGWRAARFTELGQGTGGGETSLAGSTKSFFSLVGEAVDTNPREDGRDVLHLKLCVPLQDHIGAQFSYTYRLVYPSGRVEWLGMPGDNGVISVEQGLAGMTMSEGWDVREDDEVEAANEAYRFTVTWMLRALVVVSAKTI